MTKELPKKQSPRHDRAEGGQGGGQATRAGVPAARHASPPVASGTGEKPPPGRPVPTAAAGAAAEKPPPGLDDARHAAAQKAAHEAEVMRDGLFAALMGDALGYSNLFGGPAYKVFLERLLADAGNPTDPVEKMLLEQLALAHFRVGQLHVGAAQAQGVEAAKMYNSVAARLLGEFRRTALALRVYRRRAPKTKTGPKLKLYKMAQ